MNEYLHAPRERYENARALIRRPGTHRLKKAGVLQTSWANDAIPSSNRLENHSGFRLIGERPSNCFPNAPGKRSACRPHIDLKTILFSNRWENGKIIRSQNVLRPFWKLHYT
ncbi:hypothetical protein PCANC_24880 [Puccinia coronata f. sp. avenae]|uniref:Uncharacterized protein n=1 Tax=Puccinia coronata f. sp. avenae TaxID=200324 RepID=A0A2N5UED4_9BASI|nr:hypothetical protein PCANC_24880 [Puccinia coronata f. sp. avenae]PLW36103.1 hypothetical protein PCASD_11662 [Puccinia coronata f. sp. avenae]